MKLYNFWLGIVFIIGDVFAPRRQVALVVRIVYHNVCHEMLCSSAMPIVIYPTYAYIKPWYATANLQ